ncbi:hypothetical protein [Thermococcus sp. JdF3]|uniref:hypothetical protein n=1 Tax=Thermococcus sp. JdF3 TaxID=1638258 RepID=UPI00143B0ADC|nr:hypothetical protein [Thermococcus sp. JdF3]NJE00909.1 hypothetical protein [Thermococcus sp. JdF3]
MSYGPLISTLLEETKYTIKELGLLGLNALANVIIIYTVILLLNPGLESGLILGMLAVAFSISVGIIVTSPVSWAKTLGMLEILLSVSLSPQRLLILKATSAALYGFILIGGGLVIGNIILALIGITIPASSVFITLLASTPLLFAFSLLFTLLAVLIDQKHLDSLKVPVFMISYLAPLYLAGYLEAGIYISSVLLVALPVVFLVLTTYFAVVRYYGENFSEAVIMV